jgi:hypothetical protein
MKDCLVKLQPFAKEALGFSALMGIIGGVFLFIILLELELYWLQPSKKLEV